MQIRAGNRQDEAEIRTIVFQAMKEFGILPELEGRDSDLRNIERNYFWYDGLCLAAELDGQVLGFLAGRRREGQESVLELSRLVVQAAARRQGVAKALLKTAFSFAKNLEYKSIELVCPGATKELAHLDASILQHLGFVLGPAGSWQKSL